MYDEPVIPAPLPKDEPERLATLHALMLLDTPAEERFDVITRTAAGLFDAPTALISLLDEQRQWFKSRHGLSVAETPRDVSFCGHAILDGEGLVVEDARQDPRFHDNPLVTEAPGVRFYAGMPIAAPNGMRLGTLCLIDRKPRGLDAAQRKLLKELAGWVEAEIRVLAERRALGMFLDALLDQFSEPALLADEQGRIGFANAAALRLLGYSAREIYGKPVDELVAGPQRERFRAEIRALGRVGSAFTSLEYRTGVRSRSGEEVLMGLAFFRADVAGRAMTAVLLRPAP